MNIDDIKETVDRIQKKKRAIQRLTELDAEIDTLVDESGQILIAVASKTLLVKANDLKELLGRKITESNTVLEEAELKNKVKDG
jgi:hypothetical protein